MGEYLLKTDIRDNLERNLGIPLEELEEKLRKTLCKENDNQTGY